MQFKYLPIISIALLMCLLLVIAPSFAFNDSSEDVVAASDYYFNNNNTEDGNGSLENPYKNLNDSTLNDHSIIHLASGEYNFESDRSFSEISFCGDAANTTIINANGYKLYNNGFLNFKNVTIKNLSIENRGTINASNTIFSNSQNYYGSVINSQANKEIYLDNCQFYNNTGSYGGVIYINQGILEVNNTIFENNTALVFGGAITSVKSTLKLKNITAQNNKAKYEGGVIYAYYGDFSIINSTLINNSAKNAGALFVDANENATFINNTFINNTAILLADSIYSLNNSNTNFENNTYENNDFLNTTHPTLFIGNNNYTMYMYNASDMDLPSYYNLADEGYVTSIKNQQTGGNCWAFASIGALESCILKATNQTFDFSEENMKNLMALYSDYGWNYETNKGGVTFMGVGYFTSWMGPVNESDDEYSPSSFLSPLMDSLLHIQNIVFLLRTNATDNDNIKKAILNYGGVATSIKWGSASVKGNARYYDGSDVADHAVVIVGWDDNYSKDNFAKTPEGDGAWIIKNSHGPSSGNNGYWYVSYYDTRCAQVGRSDVSYTFILNDTLKYDKNYQYDIPGRTDFFLNSSSTIWYKNIFTSNEKEKLAAVSTYFQKTTNYTIYINVNGELKHTQSGVGNLGYYTINLNEMIPLNVGDVFEIIFKVSVDGEASFPISEAVSLNKQFYKENISFLSYDGEEWLDLINLTWNYSTHRYNSQVACIKAFTILNLIESSIHLSNTEITNGFNIQASIKNQYGASVNGGKVTFNVDNRNYTVNVSNRIATLTLELSPGTYEVSATYNAEGYVSSKNNITVEVFKINTSITLNISGEFNPITIEAKVLNQYGFEVNMGNVTFSLDGVNYTVNVVNGSAFLNKTYDKFGLHNITATYNDLYYYNSSKASANFNVNITIIADNSVNVYNTYYQFKLLDLSGNPLANQSLEVFINSKPYTIKTNDEAIASLNMNFNPATYTVKIINPLNNDTLTRTITVIPRIVENKNIVMYYGANNKYKIRIRGDDGNFKSGIEVTITLNKKNYRLTTDKNGYASFKISLNPGTYTINAQCRGFKVSNIITVKSTIITKNISVKKSKTIVFTAKLLNSNGKIIKNKKVTIKFKGKTYKVKTNKKGIATLKIHKKYKVGKYTITTSYNKLTVKNTVKIRK